MKPYLLKPFAHRYEYCTLKKLPPKIRNFFKRKGYNNNYRSEFLVYITGHRCTIKQKLKVSLNEYNKTTTVI